MGKFKFILLSLTGFIFFLVPFHFMGAEKIAISHIINLITENVLDGFIGFTMVCASLVLLGTILFNWISVKSVFWNAVF